MAHEHEGNMVNEFPVSGWKEYWESLINENTALRARHNALVEAIHKSMDRTAECDKKQTDNQLIADIAYLKRIASDYFKSSHEWRCLAFAAEQKYNALVEAVKEYMKADDAWYESAMSRDHDEEHIRGIAATAARAEVDKLLEEK